MLVAMGLTAFLCTLTGVLSEASVRPTALSRDLCSVHRLPRGGVQSSFSPSRQRLSSFFARSWEGEPTISVDTDWFYRKGGALFLRLCGACSRRTLKPPGFCGSFCGLGYAHERQSGVGPQGGPWSKGSESSALRRRRLPPGDRGGCDDRSRRIFAPLPCFPSVVASP